MSLITIFTNHRFCTLDDYSKCRNTLTITHGNGMIYKVFYYVYHLFCYFIDDPPAAVPQFIAVALIKQL